MRVRWPSIGVAVALFVGVDYPVQAAQSPAPAVDILHHQLEVQVSPATHELRAVDQMTVRALTDELPEASFVLNASLRVVVVLEPGSRGIRPLGIVAKPGSSEQTVTVRFGKPLLKDETVELVWQYQGTINDPPHDPNHLRFVTPSDTAGHIGPEGVYLSGETRWYPDRQDSLATFGVRVRTPSDWHAVTHGTQLTRTVADGEAAAVWAIAAKTEALSLVANRFVVTRRDWKGVEVSTYLFPDDAALAEAYLEASIQYLETYSKLLGPYPFPKFSVVENFFPSGLGMPSFTLLGSGIVKRHYVQPYALGHEIVHSWIGNHVFNAPGQGNWVEGLTTYLANYYYEELTGTPAQAREQRRMMLLGYAVYVQPEQDYPVAQFTQTHDPKDNAIGYQKAAMIFHMVRRNLGDETFWTALRTLVARYGEKHAGWREVEQTFADASGRDLREFFAHWVEQPGAVPLPQAPSVPADPEYNLFRRIPREALPPMLNLFVTDPARAVVVPTGGSEQDRVPYVELAAQLAAKDATVARQDERNVEATKGSLLVLGGPGINTAAEWAVRGCGGNIRIEKDAVVIEGKTYQGPGLAALVSCRRPDDPAHVVTLFYGATPPAAAKVARRLFFYGWQGYLVFQDGAVAARGDLAGARDREVQGAAQEG
ncbi:MAG: M1 family metallopeptidase [Nitrospira sp.]